MAAPWKDCDYVHYLDDTAKAFGTFVAGGYSHDANPHFEAGLGGLAAVEGGIFRASLRATVKHPLSAFLASCIRATNATDPTDFTFYYGNVAHDFTMLTAQCDSFNITWGVEDPLKIAYTFNGLCATEAATGDAQEAVSGGITDAWSECDVLVAAHDLIAQSITISCRNNAEVGSAMDRRSAGYYRLPPYIRSGRPTWTCTVRTRDRLPADHAKLDADAYVAAGLGTTTIAVVSTNLSLTFSGGYLQGEPHEWDLGRYSEWQYTFGSTTYNALAVA